MKKKRGFPRLTPYHIIVLVILLAVFFGYMPKDKNPLAGKNSQLTLYAKTELGVEPQLIAEDFFKEDELDRSKVSFDMTNCDWNIAGTYLIPVLYDNQETDCVVKLQVGTAKPESKPGAADEDAVFREKQ